MKFHLCTSSFDDQRWIKRFDTADSPSEEERVCAAPYGAYLDDKGQLVIDISTLEELLALQDTHGSIILRDSADYEAESYTLEVYDAYRE